MMWMTLLLFVLVIAVGVGLFNQLIRLRNSTSNALAQIDVQLKRRYDLIPNLVETARKYLQHEQATLQAVIAARNQANNMRAQFQTTPDAQTVQAFMGAEAGLRTRLGQLFALAEAYPELKADQTLRDLNEELTHTENLVSFARQAYNDSVLAFNNAATQFPGNVIAGLFNFTPMPMLESTANPEERAPVRIQL